jgi:hypothetical protein
LSDMTNRVSRQLGRQKFERDKHERAVDPRALASCLIYNAPRQGLGPQLLSGGHSAGGGSLEKRLTFTFTVPRVDDPGSPG